MGDFPLSANFCELLRRKVHKPIKITILALVLYILRCVDIIVSVDMHQDQQYYRIRGTWYDIYLGLLIA